MNILVNAIPLSEIKTGIQRYVQCLYTELESLRDVSVSYFGRSFCDHNMPPPPNPDRYSKWLSLVRKLPDSLIVSLRVLDRMGFEERLRQTARKTRYDIYHETHFFPPMVGGLPVVYTIHDLSLLKHRDKHPRDRIWFSDLFFKRRLPRAAHIITVSRFIRDEVIEDLGISPHKITAIHLAPGSFHYPRERAVIDKMLDRKGWPREYILFVGTLEPRKNLALLVRALAMMKTDVPLLLTGWSGWGDKAWWDDVGALGMRRRIVLTGYIDDETLACLYSGASAFVYPSVYEGFGLPVLEAMACGCPVLCSNCSSLPEVAGDAAILINPRDPEALACALDKVLNDSSFREGLVAAGLQRVSLFSWKKTALETLKVFEGFRR